MSVAWFEIALCTYLQCIGHRTAVTNVNRFLWSSACLNCIAREPADSDWPKNMTVSEDSVWPCSYLSRLCLALLTQACPSVHCKLPRKFLWVEPGSKLLFRVKGVSCLHVFCVSNVQLAGNGSVQVIDVDRKVSSRWEPLSHVFFTGVLSFLKIIFYFMSWFVTHNSRGSP